GRAFRRAAPSRSLYRLNRPDRCYAGPVVEPELHPLQLSQGLIQALRDGDEVRSLATALATELHHGLDALGVGVHELDGDRIDTIGRRGNLHPEVGSRVRTVAAGGRLTAGFGFAVSGEP